MRILFVEDNDYLRDNIAELLEEEGREIVACATGEAALDAYRSRPFDVLITDVSLPGMSGMDLARAVLDISPSAWVIVSSGYVIDYGLARLGPHVRSLPKPFELEAMDTLLGEIGRSLAAP